MLRAAGVADAEVEVSVSAMAAWHRGYAEQTPPRPRWAAHDKWRRRWRPITPVEAPEIKPFRIDIDTGAFSSDVLTCLVLEEETRRFLTTG